MVRSGPDRRNGRVEVGEAFVGGEEEGVPGRQTETKTMIAVAAEEDGPGTGRIRRQSDAIHRVLRRAGQRRPYDGWLDYLRLDGKDYRHEVTFLRGKSKTASELMPRVHRVAALLKHWLLRTHQGKVSAEHLDAYLEEFTFRFNRHTSRSPGKLFYRLMQQAVAVEPVPYKSLVKCAAKPDF